MPEIIMPDEAAVQPSTSSSRMTFKEKIFGVRKHRRNPSDIEAGEKRQNGGSSSSSDSSGIEETLYTPASEKRALIYSGGDGAKDSNLKPPKNSIFASTDTLASTANQCRICHSGVDTRSNPLIAPCRCSGTMKHVHAACLIRWLEVSSEKFWPTDVCELCGFKFRRHQFWRIRGVHFPSSTYQDRVLNFLFIFLLCLMFICASIASSYAQAAETSRFRATRVVRIGNTYFSGDEVTVVIAGILFFMSFVLALCTQYRAGGTIFRQSVRFWTINRNWQIRDYNPAIDEDDDAGHSRSSSSGSTIEAALLPPNSSNSGSALP